MYWHSTSSICHVLLASLSCVVAVSNSSRTSCQWCSPRDRSLGLEAPRGQKIVLVLVLVLTKKSWEFSRLLWVWLIAGTKNNNLGRDWVLVLFSTVLSELVHIRPTVFISYTAMRVVCILFCSFCEHDMVTCSVVRVKSWSWSWSWKKKSWSWS